ncbi:UV radiation resistance protein/autophagy-related protein 14 [Dichotomocladium elegans]|nr:UV radiation resistance protein/autophagy-related protein 14 [Dichotomocladium elegans]
MTDCARSIQLTRRNWNENHRRTVAARKVLVRETISLFDFKPGVVEDRSGDIDLRGRLTDVCIEYSKEELNAAIGHLSHMLGLIVRYLGIKLPYPIFHKSVNIYVRCGTGKRRNISKMPLFLDDKNFRRFTIGMAMLNYNIAYLCHTQGVEISLSQVTNILQALMLCCRSPRLGM